MRVERLDYDLPPELVAQSPAAERDAARLMVVDARGETHATIRELAEHVVPGSLIVLNDTKVLRARILGVKEGTLGRTEIFLVRKIEEASSGPSPDPNGAPFQRWRAMGRASKPLRPGARVVKGRLVVEIEGKADDGLFSVRLTAREGTVEDALREAGQVPLPPYIKRDVSAADEERYQTVFARAEGAVAAPTAGLHVTKPLLRALEERGCEIATCTLHVGLGTFQPVTVDDLDDHPMHSEWFEVTPELAAAIERARARGAPVVAVGTTVVRALESARDDGRPGHVRACAEETRILIQPGHRFSVVDGLVTNFHLPRSTLLALVCAFAGTDRVLEAYREAVRARYRFFSYGDAMLLRRAP
jgi:S-adenosylmethionine:tRNA ribosyltransferase-isomerase